MRFSLSVWEKSSARHLTATCAAPSSSLNVLNLFAGDGPGSAAHVLAIEIRCHLLSQFDAPSTCALLRLAARHGRVHQPGPDEIGTAVVNSEVKQLTRDEDLPEEVARLLGRRRSQPVVLEASDEDDDELQLELNGDADEDSDDAGLQLETNG